MWVQDADLAASRKGKKTSPGWVDRFDDVVAFSDQSLTLEVEPGGGTGV